VDGPGEISVLHLVSILRVVKQVDSLLEGTSCEMLWTDANGITEMAGISRLLWIGTAIQLIFSTADAVPPVVFAPSQNWYVAR
jgi:hypothetical protein